MARNNTRRGNNNNPSGRNQYSNGVMEIARERPLTAAAAAAAAVGAGVFLWSRRNQISEQISNLSDQIGEWAENMNLGQSIGIGSSDTDDTAGLTTTGISDSSGTTSRSNRTRGMSETGGGNASLGAHSGGGGATGTASSRGRTQSTPTAQQ
jgi:hypothetical protein